MVLQPRSRSFEPAEGGHGTFQFHSLSKLIRTYDIAVWQQTVAPFAVRLQTYVRSKAEAFQKLRFSFLNERPRSAQVHAAAMGPLTISSQKKDLGGTARRFLTGVQARSLHLDLGETKSIEAHAAIAEDVPHPFSTAMEMIPQLWQDVFAQMHAAMEKFDFNGLCSRLSAYRSEVMIFIRKMAKDLQPLQQEMRALMPPSIALVSGQVHVPLLYSLLFLTDYPNPDFAFRFLVGAPLVGIFASPALPSRHNVKGALSDFRIRCLAAECKRRERYVVARLDREAAMKSQEKFTKELRTKTIVADFRSREELRTAIEAEIRQAWGLHNFVLLDADLVVSTQFSVIESHAYAEEAEAKLQFKVRNIFNGRILNGLATGYSTYVPHAHADIAAIVAHWSRIFSKFLKDEALPSFHGWPADFASAYRQMPLAVLHVAFSGFVYWDYDADERRYGFYRALPFGSALAPAEWSEVCVALGHIAAIVLLLIITHCIDDVCNVEMEQTVQSGRAAFIELVDLIGLRLDPDKSKDPAASFVYLGLKMVLPAAICRQPLSFSCPIFRRDRLLYHLNNILNKNSLPPSEASSMRGRLFYYCYWHQEARSYLVYLAQRQYAGIEKVTKRSTVGRHWASDAAMEAQNWPLSQPLRAALQFFVKLLESPEFLRGILPERYANRAKALLYTDGSRSEVERGIGGVVFGRHLITRFFAEDLDDGKYYPHIAVVEMRAILRALELFGDELRGRAIIFFVDNTHSIGCLLKRSSSLEHEVDQRRQNELSAAMGQPYGIVPHVNFDRLSESIKESMNELAREIWKLVTLFDLLVWFEYVNTHSNAADPPSRGFFPHCPATRIGDCTKELRTYQEFCIGKQAEAVQQKVDEARRRAASLSS